MYTLRELQAMPDYRLHDICRRKKIMTSSAGSSDSRLPREEMIKYIFRYYGKEEDSFSVKQGVDCFSSEILDAIRKYGRKKNTKELKRTISIPNTIISYKEFSMLLRDQVRIGNAEEYECCIMLDEEGNLAGVFLLREWNSKKYLTCQREWVNDRESNQYQFLFFDHKGTYHIINLFNSGKTSRISAGELDYEQVETDRFLRAEAEESSAVLFLDFGLGGMAAKVLDEKSEERGVYFRDPVCDTCHDCGACMICPGFLKVDSIDGEGKISFSFGYDADGPEYQEGCLSEQTFIREIRRFLEKDGQTFLLTDALGNSKAVQTRELVEAYLRYIIAAAESCLKKKIHKVCFVLTERQKRNYKQYLQEMLPDYEIISDYVPDKAAAVFFEDFDRSLKEQKVMDQTGKMLILDCGMGTSSLVSCFYSVVDTKVTYRLDIKTEYIREATVFGGNNLTYRILQLLKYKAFDPNYRLPAEFQDSFDRIDEQGDTSCIYFHFDKGYKELAARFPTDVLEYSQISKKFRLKIRHNYEILWDLAEKIKVLFFSDRAEYCFKLIETEKNNMIYEIRNGKPEEFRMEITVFRDEIMTLLAPEIYGAIRYLTEPAWGTDGILSGWRIRLLGQSSVIPLFRDALKEFTVGRRIRSGSGSGSAYLKMRAVEGALRYEQARRSGRIVPLAECTLLKAPGSLVVQNHDGSVTRLISCKQKMNEIYAFTTRPYSARELEAVWCDSREKEIFREKILLLPEEYQETSYEELMGKFNKILVKQADLDSVKNGEIRIFIFAECEICRIGYFMVARWKDILYRSEIQYFLFQGRDCGIDYHAE